MENIQNNARHRSRSVFVQDGKLDLPVLGLFLLINLIVLINATLHHPKIGYDATSHITYIQVLFDRLPDIQDTSEYFSPPLPYALPALFDKACETLLDNHEHFPLLEGSYYIFECRFADAKFAQYLNVLLSIGILYFVLLICEYLKPGNRAYKISVLVLFSLLTVYYKTFSQVRGEPYVAFFTVVSAYLLLKLANEENVLRKNVTFLGLSLGALILSRQWGFFLFPAIVFSGIWFLFQNRPSAPRLIKPILVSFVISAFVGGWFYLHLYLQNGTVTAFNIKENEPLSLNQFWSSLRRTHVQDFEIFKQPIRENFQGDILPTFYSETWGDYWGYFTYVKENSTFGDQGLDNAKEIAPYLGRVNLFSAIPTLILGLGWITSAIQLFNFKKPVSIERLGSGLFFFMITTSAIGYIVFLINYYAASEPTLKATYMIQAFMLIVFLGGDFLEKVRARFPRMYALTLTLLGIVFLHNLPAFITRYISFPWS